jgi:hypothetical protein
VIGAALGYADRGFAVLPLAPRAKRPLTAHGKDDATTDRATVEAWWRQSPRANVGIACRASGFVALDVDHIPRGAMPEILRALAAAAEKVTTATDDDATLGWLSHFLRQVVVERRFDVPARTDSASVDRRRASRSRIVDRAGSVAWRRRLGRDD